MAVTFQIHIEGFTHKRHDRKRKKSTNRGRDSGGVLLYLRNDIATTAETIIEYSDGVIEILGVHIKDINLVIIVIYRQPDDEVKICLMLFKIALALASNFSQRGN